MSQDVCSRLLAHGTVRVKREIKHVYKVRLRPRVGPFPGI